MAKKANTLISTIRDLEARASKKAEERLLKSLNTTKGSNRFLKKKDSKILSNIITTLEDVTGKPMFHGYIFSTNVELVVAIASTLQFMKGDLRELVPVSLYQIFDGDTRDEILASYGRLPYLVEDTVISVEEQLIVVDPEAKQRALNGIPANISDLEDMVSAVALDLGLLGEYNCTQSEIDSAWVQALSKITKQEKMNEYKDSLVA